MSEPTYALIVNTLKGTHRTGHKAAIWMRTRHARLGATPADLCATVEGRAAMWAEVQAMSGEVGR